MDLSVIDTMLHDSPDLVINRTEIWAVWRPQVGRKKVCRFLTHVRGAVCRCTVLLEQRRYQTPGLPWGLNFNPHTHGSPARHSAYHWQQYDVIMMSQRSMEEVSNRYHQNFLVCNNNGFDRSWLKNCNIQGDHSPNTVKFTDVWRHSAC